MAPNGPEVPEDMFVKGWGWFYSNGLKWKHTSSHPAACLRELFYMSCWYLVFFLCFFLLLAVKQVVRQGSYPEHWTVLAAAVIVKRFHGSKCQTIQGTRMVFAQNKEISDILANKALISAPWLVPQASHWFPVLESGWFTMAMQQHCRENTT